MSGESAMSTVPLILIALAAPIGALDMLYFHLWKFRLYRQPSARAEMVTHLLRGTIMTVGTFLLVHYRPMGAWYWAIGALLALELVNSLVDVALEPSSRATLGGIPRLESVLHVLGATFVGAIGASYLVLGWPARLAPTALAPIDGSVPDWLVWQGLMIAASGALLTLLELGLFLNSLAGARATEPYEATSRA